MDYVIQYGLEEEIPVSLLPGSLYFTIDKNNIYMDFLDDQNNPQRAKFLGGIRSVATASDLPPINEIEDTDIFYVQDEHILVSKNDAGTGYTSAIQGVIDELNQKIEDLETSSSDTYIQKLGDTMVGNLTMADSNVVFTKNGTEIGSLGVNSNGKLVMSPVAEPAGTNDVATKGYVDTNSVSSFNGRKGAVVPQSGDYTAAMVGAVPTSRTVNGKALSSNITLSAADVKALPTAGGTLTGAVTTSSTFTIGSVKISYNSTTKALEFQHL